MAEHPILFKPELVKAILHGDKTETRRVISYVHPVTIDEIEIGGKYQYWPTCITEAGDEPISCPYGNPGDVLWVREKHVFETNLGFDSAENYKPPFADGRPTLWEHNDSYGLWWKQAHYAATDKTPDLYYEDQDNDEPHCRWRPSIHMPRWACRLTLEIEDVFVERIQDITVEGAYHEGVFNFYGNNKKFGDRVRFKKLWEEINGPRGYGWDKNPWVWVIKFKIKEALCR